MKLYWWPKTRSVRAVWMLEEAGCAYQRIPVDIRGPAIRDPAFLQINPMGKVPALVDGATCVAESAAICAYVAERVPQADLAPALADPARGRYLQWLVFAPACIEPAYTQKVTGFAFKPLSAGWGDFDRVMAVLEKALANGPWMLGERFSAADVMIGTDLYFGIEVFKLVDPSPALRAYVDRCRARPAMQHALKIDAAGP